MTKSDEQKSYLKLAVKNIPADYFLDSWWGYLASKRIWVSQHGALDKAVKLDSLESAYLYNIKGCVLRLSENSDETEGANRLIGIITRILSSREEDVLPF